MRVLSAVLGFMLILSVHFNYILLKVNPKVRFNEMSISCETGALLYVLKHEGTRLSFKEKQDRILQISHGCIEYVNTYMEIN